MRKLLLNAQLAYYTGMLNKHVANVEVILTNPAGIGEHQDIQLANEVELGKQWANNKLLTSLSDKREAFGCLRRDNYVTVLYKQTSNTVPGEFLGRLVLGVEDDEVKVFGATIY